MKTHLLIGAYWAIGGAFYGLTEHFAELAITIKDNFDIAMTVSCVCALFILFLAVANWGRSLWVIR